MKVEFHRHSLGQEEIALISETCNSLFLTTGPRTKEFEEAFAGYLGARAALGLSSCTEAMFLCLKAWGIGPGDVVVVPALTFIATANVVLQAGAEVAFADVDPGTGLLDLNFVESMLHKDKRIRAIIPVHLYGQMVDMKSLRALVAHSGIKILEDAAHCIEGERDGLKPGTAGDAVAFSFYATKTMTCGEGGALASQDEELIGRVRTLRLHGMDKSAADRHQSYRHWDMVELGYKANMSDLQASLLLPQLRKISQSHERRCLLASRYDSAFEQIGLRRPRTLDDSKHAYHLYTIWPERQRDEVLEKLQKQGIGVAVNYNPVHLTSYYQRHYGLQKGTFPVAERIGETTVSLPLYARLSDDEQDYVIQAVKDAIR